MKTKKVNPFKNMMLSTLAEHNIPIRVLTTKYDPTNPDAGKRFLCHAVPVKVENKEGIRTEYDLVPIGTGKSLKRFASDFKLKVYDDFVECDFDRPTFTT